jgi:prepilin-type N-terminal cleavage/methylation domain-containing protein
MKTHSGEQQRGFTLVELIVSVGLFALVMLIATGAYFSLIALDRQARATNQVVGSLSFAMDTMTRGIRTGTNYQCTNSAEDAYGNSSSGACTAFSYSDTALNTIVSYILKANGTIGRCEGVAPGSCTDVNASALTDSSITIQKLSFYVRGSGTVSSPTSAQQPHVTFVISGRMPAGPNKTVPFTIQEGSTQRLIDY